jgi:hypothetical protein
MRNRKRLGRIRSWRDEDQTLNHCLPPAATELIWLPLYCAPTLFSYRGRLHFRILRSIETDFFFDRARQPLLFIELLKRFKICQRVGCLRNDRRVKSNLLAPPLACNKTNRERSIFFAL